LKIVLVHPLWSLENFVSLSLAELAAFVRREGFDDIRIIDLNHDLFLRPITSHLSSAIGLIREQNPDIVGIHCNNVHVPWAVKLCREIKKTLEIPVVLGGNHPTCRPEQMIRLSGCDFVVRGEGEITFTELLKSLKNSRPLSSIEGLSYRAGDDVRHNPDRPVIKDLSILPSIAFDLIDRNITSSTQRPQQDIEITASRGCPYRCIYCSSRLMWHHQRRKPVERVIGEIRHLKETYGIPEITIGDECLTVNKKWLSELLDGLKNTGVRWNCSTRIDQVDETVIRRMADSGCKLVLHGLESGSERMREVICKNYPPGTTNEDILTMIRYEISRGIKPVCSLITGIPGETRKDMEETIEFAVQLAKLGCEMQFWITTPYFGTPARERYADRLFCIRRWKFLGQWDIFKPMQFIINHDNFEEFNEENPDLLMFLPDIELSEFFSLYSKGRRRIGLKDTFPPGSLIYYYLIEKKDGLYFFDFSREVPLQTLDSAGPGETLYRIVHLMKDDTERLARRIIDARPKICILSMRLEKNEICREAGKKAEAFLGKLEKADIKFMVLRALPAEIFGAQGEEIKKRFKIPKNCASCLDLFSVTPEENILFCYGKKTFKLEYAASRKQLARFFNEFKVELEPFSYGCACFTEPENAYGKMETPKILKPEKDEEK